jgi:DNA processing protein
MPATVDLVALTLLPLWRWRRVADRLRRGDAAAAVLDAECADLGHAHARDRERTDPRRLRESADDALTRAARIGLHAVAWTDDEYPASLLTIHDPPVVLWVAGQRTVLNPAGVAIVGSRAGSPYALSVASRLAEDLAARGLTIVSGLARGVDSAAHRGALSAPGRTIAVLGCGVDVVYPEEHAALASEIARSGAVVSDLLPGTSPRPHFFPRRNRIISGLVRAVVVVEAGEKSGSLITARCALDQGRDVLAVPGNVLSGRNRGGHALIRDGARLVESADDVLEELGMSLPAATAAHAHVASTAEDPVIAALSPGEPADLDEISARAGLSAEHLLPRLFELELQGLVRREQGGRFMRTGRNVLG